jgi:putative transposase
MENDPALAVRVTAFIEQCITTHRSVNARDLPGFTCQLSGTSSLVTGWYYRDTRQIMDAPPRQRMCEIAEVRVRYGARRIHVLLRREGWAVNHKRVHRIYVQAGLILRAKRPRRRKAVATRLDRAVLTAPDQSWSMDFVADAPFNGQRFRTLTIVDNFTRECLAIEVAGSLRGDDVVTTLDHARQCRGCPARMQVDNGPEFISTALDRYSYEHGITLDYSRPGKPPKTGSLNPSTARCETNA